MTLPAGTRTRLGSSMTATGAGAGTMTMSRTRTVRRERTGIHAHIRTTSRGCVAERAILTKWTGIRHIQMRDIHAARQSTAECQRSTILGARPMYIKTRDMFAEAAQVTMSFPSVIVRSQKRGIDETITSRVEDALRPEILMACRLTLVRLIAVVGVVLQHTCASKCACVRYAAGCSVQNGFLPVANGTRPKLGPNPAHFRALFECLRSPEPVKMWKSCVYLSGF
mmetsp:Transcript_1928/g.5788  ORF Transcript_1928/g.5788 Transcript_1928/m.5788 type:complete len:225 (+) Transcript_1928:220-894(+)